MARGCGILMAKFDKASAHSNVAIHPRVQQLLGMTWHNKYYVEMAFPFSLL